MKNFNSYIGNNIFDNIFLIIASAVIFTVSAVIFFKKDKNTWHKNAPSIITTLGILCTFIGVSIGLMLFDPNDSSSLNHLLDGLKLAFVPSSIAIFLAIVFKWTYTKNHSSNLISHFFEKIDNQNNAISKLTDAISAVDWQVVYKERLESNIEKSNELLSVLELSLTSLIKTIAEKPILLIEATNSLEQAINSTEFLIKNTANELQEILKNLNINVQQNMNLMEQNNKTLQTTLSNIYAESNNLNQTITKTNAISKELGNELKVAVVNHIRNLETLIGNELKVVIKNVQNKLE